MAPCIMHEWTWRHIRSTNGNMLTTIPYPFSYSGHDMLFGSRHGKAWSPNFPSIPPYLFMHPTGLHLTNYFGYCLLDSTSGCFDPGLYPQVLSDSIVYFALFRQHPTDDEPKMLRICPEFLSLTSYWLPNTEHPGWGSIQANFLDAFRMCYINLEQSRLGHKIIFKKKGIEVAAQRLLPTSQYLGYRSACKLECLGAGSGCSCSIAVFHEADDYLLLLS